MKNQQPIFLMAVSPPALWIPEHRFTRPSRWQNAGGIYGTLWDDAAAHMANIAILKDC